MNSNDSYFKDSDIWSDSDIIMRVAIFFVITLALLFSLQIFLGQLLYNSFQESKITEALVLGITGLIGVGVTYGFIRYDRKDFDFIGFNRLPLRNVLIGAIITLIALIPTVIIELYLGILTSDGILSWEIALITFVLTFFGIGIGEEIVFRGYIESVIEVKGKEYEIIAILVSSFLFGFTHFFIGVTYRNLPYMVTWGVSAMIFGLGISLCKRFTNDLSLAISIHAFWDIYLFLFIPVFHYDEVIQQIGEIVAQIIGVTTFVFLAWILSKYGFFENNLENKSDSS